jgi:hypothetical protein
MPSKWQKYLEDDNCNWHLQNMGDMPRPFPPRDVTQKEFDEWLWGFRDEDMHPDMDELKYDFKAAFETRMSPSPAYMWCDLCYEHTARKDIGVFDYYGMKRFLCRRCCKFFNDPKINKYLEEHENLEYKPPVLCDKCKCKFTPK